MHLGEMRVRKQIIALRVRRRNRDFLSSQKCAKWGGGLAPRGTGTRGTRGKDENSWEKSLDWSHANKNYKKGRREQHAAARDRCGLSLRTAEYAQERRRHSSGEGNSVGQMSDMYVLLCGTKRKVFFAKFWVVTTIDWNTRTKDYGQILKIPGKPLWNGWIKRKSCVLIFSEISWGITSKSRGLPAPIQKLGGEIKKSNLKVCKNWSFLILDNQYIFSLLNGLSEITNPRNSKALKNVFWAFVGRHFLQL